MQLLPYLFGAGGRGWTARPTVIEAPTLTLASLGAGLRAGLHGPASRLGSNTPAASRIAQPMTESIASGPTRKRL